MTEMVLGATQHLEWSCYCPPVCSVFSSLTMTFSTLLWSVGTFKKLLKEDQSHHGNEVLFHPAPPDSTEMGSGQLSTLSYRAHSTVGWPPRLPGQLIYNQPSGWTQQAQGHSCIPQNTHNAQPYRCRQRCVAWL